MPGSAWRARAEGCRGANPLRRPGLCHRRHRGGGGPGDHDARHGPPPRRAPRLGALRLGTHLQLRLCLQPLQRAGASRDGAAVHRCRGVGLRRGAGPHPDAGRGVGTRARGSHRQLERAHRRRARGAGARLHHAALLAHVQRGRCMCDDRRAHHHCGFVVRGSVSRAGRRSRRRHERGSRARSRGSLPFRRQRRPSRPRSRRSWRASGSIVAWPWSPTSPGPPRRS